MIKLLKSCHHVTIMEEARFECCVRGYHVYFEIWEAILGETLLCRREPTNVSDHYAVRRRYSWAFAKEVFQDFFALFKK